MTCTPIKKKQVVRSRADFTVSSYTGLVTLVAAAGDIFSLRWADTTYDCIIWWLKWWWYTTTGFTAAQWVDHSLYIARAFSVSPSTATSILPTAGMNKKKTSMPHSLVTAMQLATTGAIGVPGTYVIDDKPIRTRGILAPAGAAAFIGLPEMVPIHEDDNYLAYLKANEGIILRNSTTMGAGGVIKLGVELSWSEILPDALTMSDDLSV
jgi:hypothetical protein